MVLLQDHNLISDPAKAELLKMASEAKTFPLRDFTGSEADTVVYVGCGELEGISRAKVRLCIVLMGDTKYGKKFYDLDQPAYKQAINRGLVTMPESKDTSYEMQDFIPLGIQRHQILHVRRQRSKMAAMMILGIHIHQLMHWQRNWRNLR